MNSDESEPQAVRFDLLQLPPEIRRLVYCHYFFYDRNMARISAEYQLPASVVAENDTPVNRSQVKTASRKAAAASLISNINAMSLLFYVRLKSSGRSFSYHEAIDVLYVDAPFYFEDLNVLRKFLDVRRDAGNEHLVRSIYFNWTSFVWLDYGQQSVVQQYLDEHWYPLCRRLSEMNNLRRLVVAINPGKKQTAKRNFGKSDPYQLLTWLSNLHLSLEILE